MHMPNLGQLLFEGAVYDALKSIFLAAIMTGAAQLILRFVFNRVKARREILALWLGGLVLFGASVYAIGNRSQTPYFEGSIPQLLIGPAQGSDRDEVAVIALSILNTGTMQSIVKGWQVTAEIDGNTYNGMFVQMPENFTFRNIPRTTLAQPTSITFHSEDNIAEKALKPIEVGGMTTGILFVEFSNIDQTMFRGSVTITVSYQDVLSRSYSVTARTTGQIGQVSALAGLHTEIACPMPTELTGTLPKASPLATPIPVPMQLQH
jgi:hypothetical protein